MLKHYLTISLRNLRKYKAQTAISVCSMSVSITLMAIVSSMALSVKPMPILSLPHADRTFELRIEDNGNSLPPTFEDMSLISGNQFDDVEEMHQIEWGYGINVDATVDYGLENERTIIQDVYIADRGYLKFQGIRSVITGRVIDTLTDDEIVIPRKLAKKLFGKENPIGKGLHLHSDYYGNMVPDKTYTIKDVMEDPSPTNSNLLLPSTIFIAGNEFFKNNRYTCYFVLKEGKTADALKSKLIALLPGQNIELLNVRKLYSDPYKMAVRNGIIVFVMLFVLVSFFNYLRQQLQLFRLREREVALRTCVGSRPGSLLTLFSTEIMTVLLLTLILALVFVTLISDFLLSRYPIIFENDNYSLSDAVPLTLIAVVALAAISMVAVALTIRRIRHDQTGLALRMKPLPKHRLRNVGLTLQMTICLVFTCITVLFFMSAKSIREYFGIPDDADRYRQYIIIPRLQGVMPDKQKECYDRIETLESVEKTFRFTGLRTMFQYGEGNDDRQGISVYIQNGTDAIDLYELKSEVTNSKANPDRYALVSKSFRQKLIDKNLWNGKTIILPDYFSGEFEIKGVYDYLPFQVKDVRDGAVVYDVNQPYTQAYYLVVQPMKGMAKKAMQDVNNIISETAPGRIDIKPQTFYNFVAREYDVVIVMTAIIYILAAISIVTTMAAIYAGVSLDTRRRRKEMALRKLSGAGPKQIATIFMRTYVWIILVAAVFAFPLCTMVSKMLQGTIFPALNSGNTTLAYISGLIIIVAVATFTIFWKIRDIMKADPIEYLKE